MVFQPVSLKHKIGIHPDIKKNIDARNVFFFLHNIFRLIMYKTFFFNLN